MFNKMYKLRSHGLAGSWLDIAQNLLLFELMRQNLSSSQDRVTFGRTGSSVTTGAQTTFVFAVAINMTRSISVRAKGRYTLFLWKTSKLNYLRMSLNCWSYRI
jgi:hypothetical protein